MASTSTSSSLAIISSILLGLLKLAWRVPVWIWLVTAIIIYVYWSPAATVKKAIKVKRSSVPAARSQTTIHRPLSRSGSFSSANSPRQSRNRSGMSSNIRSFSPMMSQSPLRRASPGPSSVNRNYRAPLNDNGNYGNSAGMTRSNSSGSIIYNESPARSTSYQYTPRPLYAAVPSTSSYNSPLRNAYESPRQQQLQQQTSLSRNAAFTSTLSDSPNSIGVQQSARKRAIDQRQADTNAEAKSLEEEEFLQRSAEEVVETNRNRTIGKRNKKIAESKDMEEDAMDIDTGVLDERRGSKRGAIDDEEEEAERTKRSKVSSSIDPGYDNDEYNSDASSLADFTTPKRIKKRRDQSSTRSSSQEPVGKRQSSGRGSSKRDIDDVDSASGEDEDDDGGPRNPDSDFDSQDEQIEEDEEETEEDRGRRRVKERREGKRAKSLGRSKREEREESDAMEGSFEDLEGRSTLPSPPTSKAVAPSRSSLSNKAKHSASLIPIKVKRKIGEEWKNADGDKFKLGEDSIERKLSEVREMRKKYKMPADSTHSDALEMHEVIIEKWLTKEEYDAALKDRKLAWQVSEVEEKPVELEVEMEVEPIDIAAPLEKGIYYTTGTGTPLRARSTLSSSSSLKSLSQRATPGTPKTSPLGGPLLHGRLRLPSTLSSSPKRGGISLGSPAKVSKLRMGSSSEEKAAKEERDRRRRASVALGGEKEEVVPEIIQKVEEAIGQSNLQNLFSAPPAVVKPVMSTPAFAISAPAMAAPTPSIATPPIAAPKTTVAPSFFSAPASAPTSSATLPVAPEKPTNLFSFGVPSTSTTAPSAPTPTPAPVLPAPKSTPSFSFGTPPVPAPTSTAAASISSPAPSLFTASTKPSTPFEVTNSTPAPFSFGAPPSASPLVDSFKPIPIPSAATPLPSSGFPSTAPTPAAPPPIKPTSSFSFGSTTPAASVPAFSASASNPSFGSTNTTIPAPPVSNSPFGTAASFSNTPAPSPFGAPIQPAASPFSFSASNSTAPSFGVPVIPAASNLQAASPFSFGIAPPAQSAAPPLPAASSSFSFGAPAPAAPSIFGSSPAASSMFGAPTNAGAMFGSIPTANAPDAAPAFAFGLTPGSNAGDSDTEGGARRRPVRRLPTGPKR